MPTTIAEWNELIDYKTSEAKAAYDAACAKARVQAEAAYPSLPDDEEKPALEELIAQAVAAVPQPESRSDFEAMFACYYPNPVEEEPAPTFAELKADKLAELSAAFYTATRKPTCEVDGLIIDANDTANTNVDGLIKKLEALGSNGPVEFCCADNSVANVDLATLKKFQLAIIENGQMLYGRKWQYRTAIEQAQDEAALSAIVISFA